MSLPSLTPSQVDALTAVARSWVGTPYAHLGRLKDHACDCIGLVIMVARELGISEFEFLDYGRDPVPEQMTSGLEEHLYPLDLDLSLAKAGSFPPGLEAGDILHFRWRGHPRHLGLVLPREGGGFNLVHAYAGAGGVVEHNLDKVWLTLIRAGYRYKWQP